MEVGGTRLVMHATFILPVVSVVDCLTKQRLCTTLNSAMGLHSCQRYKLPPLNFQC